MINKKGKRGRVGHAVVVGGDLSQLSLCAASAVASADLLMLDKPPTGSHGVSALQATVWKR